jgi:hypothetical protein
MYSRVYRIAYTVDTVAYKPHTILLPFITNPGAYLWWTDNTVLVRRRLIVLSFDNSQMILPNWRVENFCGLRLMKEETAAKPCAVK